MRIEFESYVPEFKHEVKELCAKYRLRAPEIKNYAACQVENPQFISAVFEVKEATANELHKRLLNEQEEGTSHPLLPSLHIARFWLNGFPVRVLGPCALSERDFSKDLPYLSATVSELQEAAYPTTTHAKTKNLVELYYMRKF